MSSDSTDSLPRSFEELGLSENLRKTLQDIGYEAPSAIQEAVIPLLLEGKDVIGQAQTGTGKTAAFALPILEKTEGKAGLPQALVLTPTRELAIQVAEAFGRYAHRNKGFRVLSVYGGQEYGTQIRRLESGVHVIVGTPGRIIDHLKRGSLVLSELKTLVLDEADEMLRMGFIDDVEWILEQTPVERQIALFSATMPPAIRRIAKKHLREAAEVTIEKPTATVASIRQRWIPVSGHQKLDALTRLLEAEEMDAALVFARTRQDTVELSEKLAVRGYSTAALNGEMAQRQRERTVEQLKQGRVDIVVATDVAARGLDVDRISHVINFDMPYDVEAYVHRIGRTGRAGRKGEAILMVKPREEHMLHAIERSTRQKMELYRLPSPEALRERRTRSFYNQVLETIAAGGLAPYQKLVGQLLRESGLDTLDVAAAMTRMAMGEEPVYEAERPAQKRAAEPRGKTPSTQQKTERPARTAERPARTAERPARTSERPARSPERPVRTPERPVMGTNAREKVRLVAYRAEVGSEHGVQPGQLVGALTNEGGIPAKLIGSIQIHEEYSTLDLPEDIPQKHLRVLKRIWVCQRPLRLSKV